MTPIKKVRVTTWSSGLPNDRPFIERAADVHAYLHERLDFGTLGIELAIDDADYCVVLNRLSDDLDFDPERTIGVVTEPSWSKNVDYGFLNKRCSRVLSHFAFPFEKAVRGSSLAIPWVTRTSTEAPVKKTRKLSIVASPLRLEHPHTNYDFRHALVQLILSSDVDCDIFGDWPGTDSRIKGPIADKVDALAPYEFSVAIENTCEPGYVTEKFIDCLLCGTTPVYLGDPLVQARFGENASVRLLPAPLDTLQAIARGEIEHHGEAVASARASYLESRNLFSQLRRVIDEMESASARETVFENA